MFFHFPQFWVRHSNLRDEYSCCPILSDSHFTTVNTVSPRFVWTLRFHPELRQWHESPRIEGIAFESPRFDFITHFWGWPSTWRRAMTLVESMPRCVRALLAVRGGYTRYWLATSCHLRPTCLPLPMVIWARMGLMYVCHHPISKIPWASWEASVCASQNTHIKGDRKAHPNKSAVDTAS